MRSTGRRRRALTTTARAGSPPGRTRPPHAPSTDMLAKLGSAAVPPRRGKPYVSPPGGQVHAASSPPRTARCARSHATDTMCAVACHGYGVRCLTSGERTGKRRSDRPPSMATACGYVNSNDRPSTMIHFTRGLSRQHPVFIQRTVRLAK